MPTDDREPRITRASFRAGISGLPIDAEARAVLIKGQLVAAKRMADARPRRS